MASRDASGMASSICLAKQADLEAVAFSCTGRRLARAAYGLGFRVWGLGFGVWGFRVWGTPNPKTLRRALTMGSGFAKPFPGPKYRPICGCGFPP